MSIIKGYLPDKSSSWNKKKGATNPNKNKGGENQENENVLTIEDETNTNI